MSEDKSLQERQASAKIIVEFCKQFAKEQGVQLEKVSWNPQVERRVDEYTLSITGNNYSFAIPVSYEDLVDYQGGVGVGVIESEIRNGIRDMATA